MIKTSLHFFVLLVHAAFSKRCLVVSSQRFPIRTRDHAEKQRAAARSGQYKGSNRFHFLSKSSRETPPTDNNSASNIVSVREWGICIKRSSICLFLQPRQLKHKLVSFRHSQSLNPLDLVKGRLLKLRWQITSRFRKRTRAAKPQEKSCIEESDDAMAKSNS